MKKNTLFVGMDVHADFIYIALAEAGRDGEVRSYGRISNRPETVRKTMRKLGQKHKLRVCYEAGPCGYVLYWQITMMGFECQVVAPTLIPKKPGDRVKTDRRDAEKLARSYRAGELTFVWVPDRSHEALRDLVRARESAKKDQGVARHRLSKFLLRNGIYKPVRMTSWTQKHILWIKTLKFEEKSQEVVFQDYLHEVEHQRDRIKALEQAIDLAIEEAPEEKRQLVAALQMLRGVGKVTAIGLMAEVGNFSRFPSPSELMGYVGTVPSEYTTGGPAKKKQGGITKTGNTHLRRMMTESAWNYRFRPTVNLRMQKCQDQIPEALIAEVKEIAWKAQHRLHGRYKSLCVRGKKPQVAITAVARELLGFVWAIAVYVETNQTTKEAKDAA
jgi:transposase